MEATPAAAAGPALALPWKATLVVTYALLMLYCAYRVHFHCAHKHSRRSFTFGLLVMVLGWSVLRAIFWCGTMVGPRDVAYSDSDAFYVGWTVGLYWVPFAMQYTSYSVFSLFLGKVVYREHWKRRRWKRMFISGFSLTNFLLFIFILVWATRSALIVIDHNTPPATPHATPAHPATTPSSSPGRNGTGAMALPTFASRSASSPTLSLGVNTFLVWTFTSAKNHTPGNHSGGGGGGGGGAPWIPVAPATYYISEVLDRQLHYVMGTAFAILALTFGLLSVRYMGIHREVLRRMLVFYPRRLGALTMVMSFVFVTRAAVNFYDAASVTASAGPSWVALHIGSGHDQSVWTVMLFLVWEIIPTMLILLTIATPHGGGGGRRKHSMDGYGAFGQISVMSGDLLREGSEGYGDDGAGGAGGAGGNSNILDPHRRWSGDGAGNYAPYSHSFGNYNNAEEDEAVAARRWLEGGDLFEDDRRYDSLPSDSMFDASLVGGRGGWRLGSAGTSFGAGSSLGSGVGLPGSSPNIGGYAYPGLVYVGSSGFVGGAAGASGGSGRGGGSGGSSANEYSPPMMPMMPSVPEGGGGPGKHVGGGAYAASGGDFAGHEYSERGGSKSYTERGGLKPSSLGPNRGRMGQIQESRQ